MHFSNQFNQIIVCSELVMDFTIISHIVTVILHWWLINWIQPDNLRIFWYHWRWTLTYLNAEIYKIIEFLNDTGKITDTITANSTGIALGIVCSVRIFIRIAIFKRSWIELINWRGFPEIETWRWLKYFVFGQFKRRILDSWIFRKYVHPSQDSYLCNDRDGYTDQRSKSA